MCVSNNFKYFKKILLSNDLRCLDLGYSHCCIGSQTYICSVVSHTQQQANSKRFLASSFGSKIGP